MRTLVALACLVTLAGCQGPRSPVALGEPAAWSAHPADGVALRVGDDGGALRLDFRFTGGGWAIARREVDLALPENYEFRFRLRGEAPANHLEFKLVDPSGENVWWHVWRDVEWPDQWRAFTVRKRQVQFAWGPQGGGDPARIAAIEIAITAGNGGDGTVWIDGLELVERPRVAGEPPAPAARASSRDGDHRAALALDGDPASYWASAPADRAPAFTLDLRRAREFGGLTVSWLAGRHAVDYVVEARDDEREPWRELLAVNGANGGRDDLCLPGSEARRLRLRVLRPAAAEGVAIAEIDLQPVEWSATPEAFFRYVASAQRRGLYPRGFVPEQVYWTVAGADRDPREGLVSEDGAIEAGPGGFSVEPFLWTGDSLLTWADVGTVKSLVDGELPLPRVVWVAEPWRLEIDVAPVGAPGASALRARYTVANTGAWRDTTTLYLAVRPFQVNPPSQFLNIRGGTSAIGTLALADRAIVVDGRPRVLLRDKPSAFGAATFAAGDIVAEHLESGRLPATAAADDPFGAASAAAAYRLSLAAGETDTVEALLPLHDAVPANPWTADPAAAWREALARVSITGPPAADDALATLRAQLGYILVNRAGVAIQPGARSYARSWIRDGALTGEALLRLGHPEAAVDFLEWFAAYQYESGKIPCVVDRRGADPVPEHDSTGEFIHLVCECYRYTGDRALLARLWPRVTAGVRYLETLLAERRTAEFRGTEFYGILPPSISHEGYSAKPMHSYWDDFWALRGLRDATWLAGELEAPEAAILAAARDSLAADLAASIAAAMERHAIDFVPGCADLGDFDATSTTIALAPADAAELAPAGAIERTFERYWENFTARRTGEPWEAFTPYELRNLGAFVRLGWRERAGILLEWFLAQRRPAGWRHWAEVVWSDERAARFIGDMPHTWVGSDYVRAVLDMFAYERRGESGEAAALVLAAGLPAAWLEEGGVRVRGLATPYGTLDYALRREGGAVVMEVGGGLQVPAGGLALRPPEVGARVTVDGAPVAGGEIGGVLLAHTPATVVWSE
ncbi:MAG TPA: discoidin domain-containing protein [Candidatus Krumholzibacteria bacterium]|nr:discoidin domain-containing protein [Candidatus Krumholzibacteria bacterium]HPD70565.1 discoidin domain-containing protein [Candidatus Krumholzibacteria bacterium]HRY39735.1 discoidin domain-containing protein [Candidatus Krumholzibacteria bacterium]